MEWASQLMPPNVGEVRNALRDANPAARSCVGAGVEDGVDLRRERRTLDGDPAVALDERDDDVLAAQAGEQVLRRRVAERVGHGKRSRELVLIPNGRAYRSNLVVGEPGRARRRDRRAGTDLHAEGGAQDPDDAEHSDGPG